MRTHATSIPDYLTEALDDVRADRTGAPAGLIPQLATADPPGTSHVRRRVRPLRRGLVGPDARSLLQRRPQPLAFLRAVVGGYGLPGEPACPPRRRQDSAELNPSPLLGRSVACAGHPDRPQ
ncbi:MAG: hypothetical protein AVDCRST_MAG06-1111 [uncultured Nocardioides sp.]|uniref:Uncharacterized protein n=1 Tax=uncultured Nocardioides sp. TaxID=198441 RepID=A0A6J4NE25_9ACTN|nr:MAG: hypothetical protein AVDCRST_MAG06-1111 [uncultured Nocardioides sp.]